MTNSLRTWKWPSRNSECSHETWWIFPVRFLWTWKPGGSHGGPSKLVAFLEVSTGLVEDLHRKTHGLFAMEIDRFRPSTGRQHGWWHVWWPIFERIWDVQQKEQQMGTSSSKLNWWELWCHKGKPMDFSLNLTYICFWEGNWLVLMMKRLIVTG